MGNIDQLQKMNLNIYDKYLLHVCESAHEYVLIGSLHQDVSWNALHLSYVIKSMMNIF